VLSFLVGRYKAGISGVWRIFAMQWACFVGWPCFWINRPVSILRCLLSETSCCRLPWTRIWYCEVNQKEKGVEESSEVEKRKRWNRWHGAAVQPARGCVCGCFRPWVA